MMQFKDGTHVYSADNHDIGSIQRVVVDPSSNEVTHVVVRQGLLFTEDKVIPLDLFVTATPDKATVSRNADQLDELPNFEETHYLPLEKVTREPTPEGNTVQRLVWYPPVGMDMYQYPMFYGPTNYPEAAATASAAGTPYVERTQKNIPDNTVTIKEGGQVITSDNQHVGNIERVILNSDGKNATHFVIAKGLFLRNHKLVPMNWVNAIHDDHIHLKVNADTIEALPEYEPA
ncbi:MAG TPA: PRC-barrel domain-containing protein [Phototrophicaceae bacterium]|jgi:uncharacterized protein YrrD|nr:PRC-barrel domain-containing protein [Phototrophicaceae bacterium]